MRLRAWGQCRLLFNAGTRTSSRQVTNRKSLRPLLQRKRRAVPVQNTQPVPTSAVIDVTPPEQPQPIQPITQPVQPIPQPVESSAVQSDQMPSAAPHANSNLYSGPPQDMIVGDSVVIRADLSIAHDGIVPDQSPRFTGAPPLGRKRGSQQAQPQQPHPEQQPEPVLAETFQPAPQSAEADQYSSLSSDVPPGVVVHTGPVAKGKRKEQQQASVNHEDPNQQPTSFVVPDSTETVASYDYTLHQKRYRNHKDKRLSLNRKFMFHQLLMSNRRCIRCLTRQWPKRLRS